MYGYKIKFNSLPEVVWACDVTIKDYVWKNNNKKDMIEISVSEFQNKTRILNEKTSVSSGNDITCIVGDEDVRCCCEKDSSISITSVSVRIPDLEYTKGEFTEKDYEDNSVILLPAFTERPPVAFNICIIKALHEMIHHYSSSSESSKKAFSAEFLGALYKFDEFTRNMQKKANNNYYIEKTNYLINKFYQKKITLTDVAKELNLSSVYLSKIYKEHTGITFSQQLLNVRMYNAEKMLLNKNRPASKIAEQCGFCDESHFRKTFRKFFGVNVRDYRNIKNGVTLYHEKPVREDV